MNEQDKEVRKQEKHILICERLDRLYREIRHLKSLVDNIEGIDESAEKVTTDSDPASLLEFLNSTPDRIDKFSEVLSNQVTRLKESLFL